MKRFTWSGQPSRVLRAILVVGSLVGTGGFGRSVFSAEFQTVPSGQPPGGEPATIYGEITEALGLAALSIEQISAIDDASELARKDMHVSKKLVDAVLDRLICSPVSEQSVFTYEQAREIVCMGFFGLDLSTRLRGRLTSEELSRLPVRRIWNLQGLPLGETEASTADTDAAPAAVGATPENDSFWSRRSTLFLAAVVIVVILGWGWVHFQRGRPDSAAKVDDGANSA